MLNRLRDSVVSKLAEFEAGNRALRLLLRERQRHELSSSRLLEQRDILLKVSFLFLFPFTHSDFVKSLIK